jgi:hypothetical protein
MQESEMAFSGLISKMRDYIHTWSTPEISTQNSTDTYTTPLAGDLSQQKQQQLQMLCNKLFEKRELIASGKIQLLGLNEVRQRIGQKRWPAMRGIIFEICDDAIKTHSDCGDLFFRHSDESYLLIFATSTLADSERKVALIAEEIRSRLFEEEGIDDIEIVSQTSQLRKDNIDPGILFTGKVGNASPEKQISKVRRPLLKSVQVGALSTAPRKTSFVDLGIRLEDAPFQDVQYVPIWDQAKKRLIANLCLAKGDEGDNPIEAHWSYYASASLADRVKVDLAILARAITWMQENPEKLTGFGIICPVHYETILGGQGAKRYHALCQLIEDHMKPSLLFMVLEVPPSTPWFILSKMTAPLKAHARMLCAHLSQYEQADYTALRQAGFDNVGIILSPISGKRASIRSFVARAVRHPTMKTFVLGIDDPFAVSEAINAGIRFLGGQAIHAPIADPAQKPDFGRYLYAWMEKARSRV